MSDDEFLTKFRESPRSEFADQLYERINKPMYRSSPFSKAPARRAALAFASLFLLLTATLVFSPQARAFAQARLRQIGAIIFVDMSEDTSAESPTAAPTVPAPAASTAGFADSLEEASRLAGFTVLSPGYLPPGYGPASRWSVEAGDSGVYVVTTFETADPGQFLTLNQNRYTPGSSFEQGYADNETLQDVTVGDSAAVWISGRLMTHPDWSPQEGDTQPELLPTNWLVWEASDMTYALFGTGLDQEQMLRIGESMIAK